MTTTGDLLELIVCTECKTRVEYHEDRDGYMSCECWVRSTPDDPTPKKWVEIFDMKCNPCGVCRQDIPERSVFRCADCGLPFHQTCLDQHCKHGNQKQELRSENLFLKQQVRTLDEYVTKGVAFRDELQARIKELEGALDETERAYPPDVFSEPGPDDFAYLCVGPRGMSERLHGPWARHLVKMIRERVALKALEGDGK